MKKHYAYESPFNMVDKEGNKYRLTIKQDDYTDPREWSNVSTMVFWHRNYNLGDKHEYQDSYCFLQDMTEIYISESEIERYILDGGTECCRIENGILYNRLSIRKEWYEVGEYDKGVLLEELEEKDFLNLLMESEDIVIVPVNMCEHSGITISTSSGYPYNDRWDSGCIGFAYITREKAMNELCVEPVGDSWKQRARECIDAEVEVYDQYLRGDVYGYTLDRLEHYRNETKCPCCGEVVSVEEYDEWVSEDSCWGFYGDELESNGILDDFADFEFVE